VCSLYSGSLLKSEVFVNRRHFIKVAGLTTLGVIGIPVCARAADTESGWRSCKKCEGLWFAKGGEKRAGKCPDGGAHDATGSEKYELISNEDNNEGQKQWRRCNKCEGLWFAGGGLRRLGKCPDGGSHDSTNSEKYVLIQNDVNAVGQDEWRWCHKCEGLWFGGDEKREGKCPAGGTHTKIGSGNYVLRKE
jgi:acetyl-CoA carboxylase beta subunit